MPARARGGARSLPGPGEGPGQTGPMRLFAAVLPPADVSRDLAAELAVLRKLPGADGLRWTGRPGWHFTLAFYGEVGEDVVPELSARLERAAHRTPAFELAVRGGGDSSGTGGRCGPGPPGTWRRCGCWPSGRRRRPARRAWSWGSTGATRPT
ncbi:hypothetical protein GCM10020295_46940 [Streptomyces cinereospinus]